MDILLLPFMQRAFIGGIIISILLAYFGIFAMLRRSSFFGDAIAHSSLTGVALGILMGINPILMSMAYAVLIAFVLPLIKKKSHLHTDSLLGIILPVSMALGVILLSVTPGYQPELMSFLFGSILGISWEEILVTGVVALLLIVAVKMYHKKLLNISFDPEYSQLLGIHVRTLDVMYHVGLAVAIVLGIQLVGIVLVNALLIIPAATARLFAKSLKEMFLFAPIISVVTTVVGLLASYAFNFPSGPTIAVISGVGFGIALFLKRL